MNNPNNTTPPRKTWFDGTINIPTILSGVSALVAVCVFGVANYNSLSVRVQRLEDKEVQQDTEIKRLEQTQTDTRNEIRDQLRDLSSKLDRIMYNQYGNGSYDRSKQQ